MSDNTASPKQPFFYSWGAYASRLGPARYILIGLVAGLVFVPEDLKATILQTLTDAYIQVSVFVAATLALFYTLEDRLKIDTDELLKKYTSFQVPIAAFLGALPGCGGAIIVMTQFIRGRISFGAVVAVLTATMGDAAFLLLAQKPLVGLAMIGLGITVGTISGYIVDFIHKADFLRPEYKTSTPPGEKQQGAKKRSRLELFWLALIVPGLILGVLTALQIDTDALLGNPLIAQPTIAIGTIGALLSLLMWAFPFLHTPMAPDHMESLFRNSYVGHKDTPPVKRLIHDTNFVTAWVIAAFLIFELAMYFTGFDLGILFKSLAVFVPLMGVVIGLIPGCGPQIIVTTLYINGLVPLSAQIGNAISNDGDALFPAIALAPKASIIATLYSAIPAILCAYGFYFLFEA